jgi:hypothetical protein
MYRLLWVEKTVKKKKTRKQHRMLSDSILTNFTIIDFTIMTNSPVILPR